MSRASLRPRRAILGSVCLLAITGTALSACGSGDDSSGAKGGGSGGGTVTIPFGLASVNMNYAPYVVGEQAGIFKKHGIDLKLVLTRDAATAEAAVSSGSTPLGSNTTDALALGASANPKVGILMEVTKGTPYSLVVDPAIKTVQDLRGKGLAASGLKTADGGIIRAMLKTYGMEQGKDYTLVIAGDPASRAASLSKHKTSGLAAPEPQV